MPIPVKLLVNHTGTSQLPVHVVEFIGGSQFHLRPKNRKIKNLSPESSVVPWWEVGGRLLNNGWLGSPLSLNSIKAGGLGIYEVFVMLLVL